MGKSSTSSLSLCTHCPNLPQWKSSSLHVYWLCASRLTTIYMSCTLSTDKSRRQKCGYYTNYSWDTFHASQLPGWVLWEGCKMQFALSVTWSLRNSLSWLFMLGSFIIFLISPKTCLPSASRLLDSKSQHSPSKDTSLRHVFLHLSLQWNSWIASSSSSPSCM